MSEVTVQIYGPDTFGRLTILFLPPEQSLGLEPVYLRMTPNQLARLILVLREEVLKYPLDIDLP